MGWKSLKERFGISHIVQVDGKQLLIGSGYVHNLATIDLLTGKVTENPTFPRFLAETYPDLLKAASEELVGLLEAPDTFTQSVTVYTYDGANIVEKQCEAVGWPNVTHDGAVMYENTFSTDKATVVSWAKRNAASGSRLFRKRIQEVQSELESLRTQLSKCESDLAKLDADYPDIHAKE